MTLNSSRADRFLNSVVTTLVGVAVGISVNGLYDDYGWRSSSVSAAAAGATLLLVRLRRLPPRAPLGRLVHRVFLVLTFAALVTGAFGSGGTARYALLVAVGAVIVVLVTTPGVHLLKTLFRVAVIGVILGYLSASLSEWDRSNAMKFAIIGGLMVLVNVYLLGWDHGFKSVAAVFAAPRADLAIRPLGAGTAAVVLGVVGFSESALFGGAVLSSLGLAMIAVGLCLLKGGPHAGAIAVIVVGLAVIVTGAAFPRCVALRWPASR